MLHTLAVLVENNPGVLARVSGLFSRRGFNIDSLAVGRTDDPTISRMTIVVEGDERVLEQVRKQLDKLVDIIKIDDISAEKNVDRELIIIKVNADTQTRADIMQIVDIFRAHVVDIGLETLIIEATGDSGKVNGLEEALKPFGIKEVARTGKIAMLRGAKSTSLNDD